MLLLLEGGIRPEKGIKMPGKSCHNLPGLLYRIHSDSLPGATPPADATIYRFIIRHRSFRLISPSSYHRLCAPSTGKCPSSRGAFPSLLLVRPSPGERERAAALSRGRKGRDRPGRAPQTVKKPLESSRGPQPSRISIVPGGVYAGGGVIFALGNFISQSKNHFIAVFAPGNPKDFSENWRGWQWRGSLLPRPPACQNTILTS